MRAILMSIKHKWCELIFNGEKTVEVRKTAPKLKPPFKVYVYESIGQGEGAGAVVGEFVCDSVVTMICAKIDVKKCRALQKCERYSAGTCLTAKELYEYSKGDWFYGWHITKPKRYNKPKYLFELAPWCEKSRNTGDNLEMCCYFKNAFFDENGAFCGCGVTRPPQSCCYVEEIEE